MSFISKGTAGEALNLAFYRYSELIISFFFIEFKRKNTILKLQFISLICNIVMNAISHFLMKTLLYKKLFSYIS